MSLRKRILLISLFSFCVLLVVATDYYLKLNRPPLFAPVPKVANDFTINRLEQKASALTHYLKAGNFNDSICFFVDMKIASGKNRFFVFDLKNQKVLHASLVTHGRCNENWLNGRKYSNVIGSGCTSLGKYKIGKSYYGKFGLAYKLHGLDSSNANAYNRFVVLHSHDCVPEREIHPYPICQSDGCPTVSPGVLKKLQAIINKSRKPVLLEVYD